MFVASAEILLRVIFIPSVPAVAVYVKYGEHGGYTAPVAREIFAQYLGMNAATITEDTSAVTLSQIVG